MSIAFLTEHVRFPWQRQLTDRPLQAGFDRFTFNRIDADCKFLVVYDDIAAGISVDIPRERRFVVLSEPPGIKAYRPAYLRQFGTVIGPVAPNVAPAERAGLRWMQTHAALPWFYGIGFLDGACVPNLSFEQLAAMPPPPKKQTVSVVISAKTRLPMHRQRLAFVEALKQCLGERLQVFGTGFTRVPDKADAIAPHAYHLVLENNDVDHFWTEKTADALLGWSLPLFSGCRNLDQYFPDQAFIRIDPGDSASAVAQVERILSEQPYDARLPAIAEARQRLINRHELGTLLREATQSVAHGTPELNQAPALLRANRDLGPAGKWEPFARSIARRLLQR